MAATSMACWWEKNSNFGGTPETTAERACALAAKAAGQFAESHAVPSPVVALTRKLRRSSRMIFLVVHKKCTL
jgi:hypothetical protein